MLFKRRNILLKCYFIGIDTGTSKTKLENLEIVSWGSWVTERRTPSVNGVDCALGSNQRPSSQIIPE